MVNLRERQIAALRQMLNLNQEEPKSKIAEPVWKVLIYDKFGQDIISPLLAVKELRELGVTFHAQLHSDRDSIPDVPAVYFVIPNEENITRIGQDFQSGLYDSYYINFIGPISRVKLDDLAELSLQANCVSQIQKVYDQFLNFISLEDDLFIARQQKTEPISYFGLNKGNMEEDEMDANIDILVDSLFSVFATLSTVPIIRCPKEDNAAKRLGLKLDMKLRENYADKRNNLFYGTGNFSSHRPLLIILDRNVDMATPLHHTWTYQALAHDILDLKLNRVVVEEAGEKTTPNQSHSKPCQLDSNDNFWVTHKGSPFPTVAEAIQNELEQCRASEDKVKNLKQSMGNDEERDDSALMVSDNTAKLTSAINSLPELLEKKRLVDMHTTLATAILKAIKNRRLDTLFEIEEKIMGRHVLDTPLTEILSDKEVGSPEDKLRLFLIYFLCTPSIPDNELKELCILLEDAGCDLSSLRYLKRSKSAASRSQYMGSGTKTVSMFSKLVSQGSSFVMEGVKNLVVKKHNLPVTRIVDALMEQKTSAETEDYLYLDPKKKGEDGVRPKTQEAIVFVVGGGNYIEYQNLVDYTRNKQSSIGGKRIIYGASSLINGKEFIRQLTLLGEELK